MSIDCFEELFISEFCDIIIFSCLLYNALLMSFPHDYQFTNLQGHATTIFGKYSEDDLRSRIFGTFFPKFVAWLPLLGFSNI